MEQPEISYGMDILIEKGEILSISNNKEINDANIIDCTGKFIMPGLFDMHVHINSSDMHKLFIANGVTSVRNMWGFPLLLEWNKESEKGDLVCPRIFSTGPLADGVEYWKGSVVVTTPKEAEEAVQKIKGDGYLYFKAYPSISKDAFLHLLAIAKRHNIKVVGHGNYELSWKTLSDFGYYCCEHSSCLPDDESDIEYAAKSGMWLCPTHCAILAGASYLYSGKPLSEYPYKEYLTKNGMESWVRTAEWRKRQGNNDLTRPEQVEHVINKARRFIDVAGTSKVILGTDTPNPGVIAGFTILEELHHMVEIFKFSAYEAIKAGTVNAALHLGIEDKKGKLAKGFDADMLILNGNPLLDISNVSKIEAVIKGGRLFERLELDTMLAEARNLKDQDVVSIYSKQ